MLAMQVDYPNPLTFAWTSAHPVAYNDVVIPCTDLLMHQDSTGTFHLFAPGTYLFRLYYQLETANAAAGITGTLFVGGAPSLVIYQGNLSNCYAGTFVTPQLFFMLHVTIIPTTVLVSFTCSNTALSSQIAFPGTAATYSTINYYF
jgi:hypothetical protein